MKIKNRFDRVLKMLTVFAMTLSCFTDMPIRVVAESFDVDSVISIESHNNGTDANDSEASLAVSVTVNGQTVTAPKSVAPGTLTVRANEGFEIDSMILDGTEFNESTDVQAGEHSLNITAHSTASQSNESEEIQQPDPTVEPTPTITPDPTPEVSEDPQTTGTPETTVTPEGTSKPTESSVITNEPNNSQIQMFSNTTRKSDDWTEDKYPKYLTVQEQGQGDPGDLGAHQADYACQKSGISGYADQRRHYVTLKYSTDPNAIAYVRCDVWHEQQEKPDPEEVTYAVSYVYENGELINQELVNDKKSPANVPEVENLDYWYDQGDTEKKSVVPESVTITGPVTFVAKIKEPATKFTVMYTDQSAAGGSAPIDSNSPYEIGASVTVLGNTGNLVGNKGDNPTTDFICWSTNQNRHGNYYYPGQTFIIQENMTFYPVFRGKVEYYTINFEASAGGYIQGRTEFSAMPNTEFSLAVPSSEIPEAIANDGYEFDGWYIGDTYIGKTNEEITKYFNQVNSNIVISAHFKQKQVLGKNNYFAGFYVLKKGQSVDSTDKAYFFDVDKLYPSKVQGPANYEYVKYLNSGVLARSYEVSGRYLLHISNSIIKDPQEWNGEASSVSNHFVQSPSADQIQTALASNGFDSNSEVVWYRIVEAPEGWHVDGYVRDTSEDKVNVTFFVDNEVVMNSPVKKGEALSNDQIPVDPSKKDMKFVGWYTQDGIEFVENMTFNEDTVFYAGFSNQDEITISYVSENQSMGVVSPTSESLLPESGIAKGSTATANAGYRFVNWTYKGNAVSQNTKLDRNTIDQYAKENGSYIDATFVANFEKDPNQWVTVTFLPGEHGTLEGADAEGKVQTLDLLKGYDSYPSAPTVNAEEDWGFKGWDKEVATGEIPMEATDET
ncbi:InlB B-repeat-containing protein, partial [Holdemania filiformis]